MREASAKAWILKEAAAREDCALRSLSHRAESAFRSSIMACQVAPQMSARENAPHAMMMRQLAKDAGSHCSQITIGGDIVAFHDLASLGVLRNTDRERFVQQWRGSLMAKRHHRGRSRYLVESRPHQGIIPQVATDVGGDNLAIDAIAGHEVLVLTRHGSGGDDDKGLRRGGGGRWSARFG